ncbi:tetratricopeptide repeat protein [Streptomyces sp. NPDC002394]
MDSLVAGAAGSLSVPMLHQPVRGRDAVLAELSGFLSRRPRTGRFVVVAGTGGIGKTTVAVRLAERARATGRSVFWIRWRGESELAEQLVQVAVACGLDEETLESARAERISLSDAVWDHLARTRKWLIVLDNLDDPGSLAHGPGTLRDYRGWIRPCSTGLLLITSRITDQYMWGNAANLVRLAPLLEQDGAQVLLDIASAAGSPTEAGQLAQRLGGLPLALHAAARYLAAPGSRYHTFAAYQQALDTELAHLIGASHPRASDPEIARMVVRHTWDLSLDQITDSGVLLARPVLRLLSLLASAPFPSTFITAELVTAATGQPATPPDVEAAVNELVAYGLLDTSPGGNAASGAGNVILHPLVREITALALTQDTPHVEAWHHALALLIGEAIYAIAQEGLRFRTLAQSLIPHALAIAGLTGNRDTPQLYGSLTTLAAAINDGRPNPELLTLCEHTSTELTRLRGSDHPDTLIIRSNLAVALDNAGRYREAVALQQQVLDARLRVLGPDHPATLVSRSNLANVLARLGHHSDALALHQETFDVRLRTLGPDHPDTLTSCNDVAQAFAGMGQTQTSAALHVQNYEARLRVLGPDHPATLETWHNFGVQANHAGLHQEALRFHWNVFNERMRVLGPDHPDTLHSRLEVGSALDSLGQHRDAVRLHRENLSECLRLHGPDAPFALDIRRALAIALTHLGRHLEAAETHLHNYEECARILGADHPNTLRMRAVIEQVEAAASARRRRS